MIREMLKELIDIVKQYKNDHPELYKYLTVTYTACKYDSTLYACNLTGSIMLQRHLQEFEPDILRFYENEINKNEDL